MGKCSWLLTWDKGFYRGYFKRLKALDPAR